MLEVHGVTKRFAAKPAPVDALVGVDLSVQRGMFAAVLGASGCGKTTLLRIIAGFERPDAGEVRIDGRLVASPDVHVAPEHRNVGIVAQDGALFPHLNVAANIAYGLDGGWRVFRSAARRAERAERVEELLDLVGLPGIGARRPDELSGGQQQRVALARALAPRPSMILLDEPFSALDAGLRVEVREQVRDVLKALGTTAVLVTHDQSEALSMADRVAIMRSGSVVQYGTPSEVYSHPGDAEVAGFLGDAVLLAGTVIAPEEELALEGSTMGTDGAVATLVARGTGVRHVRTALGILAAATVQHLGGAHETDGGEARCTVVLRPEQLELADTGLPGTVSSVSFYGHDGLVRLDVPELPNGVTVRCNSRDLPRIGERVRVRVVEGTLANLTR